ncbi:MAG: protein translocase subunit SecDF [Verrucomicrobia bacterium]|nr:MAG: protein translocase subunit SecDF [Verrucomicrobiota bacterium]
MSGKILWKLIVALVVVGWAVLNLIPVKDTPFDVYLAESVTSPGFTEVLDRATARIESGESPSLYLALKQIGEEDQIDLSQYFPEIRIEQSLVNVRKRNALLLDELLRRSKGRLQLGLDLKGGVAFTLEVTEQPGVGEKSQQREEDLAKAIEIIGNRVNAFGVAEPIIRPVGTNRIEVQLAGLSTKDNPEIVKDLKKPARLDFRLVHPTATPTGLEGEIAPPGYEVMVLEQERAGKISTEDLFIKRIPEMTGESISEAYPSVDDYGSYRVLLRFTGKGSDRFADVTRTIEENNRRSGRLGRLAIILDGTLFSAPTVRQEIRGGSAEITGSFTQREAIDLSNVLNNPLDLPLEVVEMYEVGPSLAEDAISSGVRAAVIGGSLVIGFMVMYFTIGGVVAMITLAINVIIVLGVLASVGATITLPGIAGIVLTVGMAVDANILIFERIREELKAGKTLPAAVSGGFDKVFSTIVDANLTTLITSGVMIWLGTGPVKGFGITLAIGIFATVFSSLLVTRMFLDMLVGSGLIKKLPMVSILNNPNYDFLKFRKPAFMVSWTIVLLGVIGVFVKRDTIYGIDFVGGDEIVLSFVERIDVSEIRRMTSEAQLGAVIPIYQSQLGTQLEILKIQTEIDRGVDVADLLMEKFPAAEFDLVGENQIGASVGREIQLNAFMAIGVSLIGILLYVAFRFEIGYGMGAVVATIHDILMTIGVFVLFNHQFNAPMVAAILLIAGYSLNDTIVVFDRIREELTLDPDAPLGRVINLAINRVLSRSLLTSFTTLLAAGSLFLFGGGVITDIAFTFIIGILTGTFSSIFIASPVFYWWHKGDRRHVEASHDITPKYDWVASSKASK